MSKPMRIRWAGLVARMRKKNNAHRFMVGEPEGKKPVGKLRSR
jgi:hypothetical protein